jgi:hypothetical protein
MSRNYTIDATDEVEDERFEIAREGLLDIRCNEIVTRGDNSV